MKRKQFSLVPIRDDSPQGHHFTITDQVNQLIAASEADPSMGFMGRLLALCSLPRSNPGNRREYKRVNGPYTLYMVAGGGNKLPYGNFPRLLMAWVCSEAVRTQSRVLVLGSSLAKFMRELGIYSSGGGNVQIKLRNQMKRLFDCTVKLTYKDERGEASVNALIARRTEFWWNPKRPNEPTLWESKIELSEDFFNEIISHPVPFDMNTLTALKRSSLGLDLYLWLVYRTFTLQEPLLLSWRQVYRQFGLDPDRSSDRVTVRSFQREVLRELQKIKLAWDGLNYTTSPGVLILHPSTPAIPPAPEPMRLVE